MSTSNSERDGSYPDMRQGELVAREGDGTESRVPVLLRDGGLSGIGAVYVGQQAPPTTGELSLVPDEGTCKEVRLVRARRSAEYVYLLGFTTDS